MLISPTASQYLCCETIHRLPNSAGKRASVTWDFREKGPLHRLCSFKHPSELSWIAWLDWKG
jgi:hypothetical protein